MVRYDPVSSSVLTSVKLPVSKVTSCCWGGKNFDELYVTSARCVDGRFRINNHKSSITNCQSQTLITNRQSQIVNRKSSITNPRSVFLQVLRVYLALFVYFTLLISIFFREYLSEVKVKDEPLAGSVLKVTNLNCKGKPGNEYDG